MRLLADESCDFSIVRHLRKAGYPVLSAAESMPSRADEEILHMAARKKCVLITEDRDFGRWVYANRRATAGVLYLRYPLAARSFMQSYVEHIIKKHGRRLSGAFTVIQPGRIRIGRNPEI